MTTDLVPSPSAMAPAMPRQAETDDKVIGLWLHGRSKHTQRAYRADVDRFLAFVGKPLASVTVGDVQAFATAHEQRPTATQARLLSSVKSLLTFAQRMGYVPFNVGTVVSLPKAKNILAERILEERDVILMLGTEPSPRNRTLLELLYYSGCRISELCGLTWRDVKPNKESGQVTLFGKGGKTRAVLLPSRIYQLLSDLRQESSDDSPVFLSREGNGLSPVQVHRIVKNAAKRAGLSEEVSAHWLRHAHASHALDNGAPVHLVQATLGHASLTTTTRYVHAKPSESSSSYLK